MIDARDHEAAGTTVKKTSTGVRWMQSSGGGEGIGWELFHYDLDVASGRKKTWTEVHRIHNDLALFNPAPLT